MKALTVQKEAGVNPYPHKFQVTISIPEYVEKYQGLESGERREDQVAIAGILLVPNELKVL